MSSFLLLQQLQVAALEDLDVQVGKKKKRAKKGGKKKKSLS